MWGSRLSEEDIKKGEAEIKEILKNNDIVIFASTGCGYCTNAKQALEAAGKKFLYILATDAQAEALERITKQSSFPNCWVKSKFVGGCNDGPESWMGIKPLLKSGKLDEMLKV